MVQPSRRAITVHDRPAARSAATRERPLDDHRALKLGHGREHSQRQLRHRVVLGADLQALRDRDEPDPGRAQPSQVREEIERRASPPIDPLHEHDVDRAALRPSSTRASPGRTLLLPDAVSSTSSTTRRPRAAAAARNSVRASRRFCSRVLTRW